MPRRSPTVARGNVAHTDILIVSIAALCFGATAGRLRGSIVTMPMLFTAAGVLLGPAALGLLDLNVRNAGVRALAEATLVVVLFTDASRMNLRTVLREHNLALRLLGLGLPLAILYGTGAGMLLLPELGLAAAALLAAALAPTDAALGQAFVSDDALPSRIRQTLNVESGLNDGLAVPFITVLIDVARHETASFGSYLVLFARLVGAGMAIGGLVGWLGGRLLSLASCREWSTDSAARLATVSVAAVAFAGSELLGGNGFVAAFSAGLAMGTSAQSLLPRTTAFAQAEGELLALLTFLVFGSTLVGAVLEDISWSLVGYALVSLFVVRPAAVALSLLGSGVRPATSAFVAWAGPRGLASIVYALLIAEAADVPKATEIFVAAALTILLSIYLHGTSAAPLSARYGAYLKRVSRGLEPEHKEIAPLPVRMEGEPHGTQHRQPH